VGAATERSRSPGETHDDIDTRALLDRLIHEVESWDKVAQGPAPPAVPRPETALTRLPTPPPRW
jgi:hypothetical protein